MLKRLFVGGLLAAAAALCMPAIAAAQGYHATKLYFMVHVGPGHATPCKVVGELYRPDSATSTHRVPSILTTNGFGGSYASQADVAKEFAGQGYAVLAYSGLGFGGSSCRIAIDSSQYDGEAAQQLVTFLGGGSAATNGTRVNFVELNKRAANGKHYAHDPEVGMIGGSYGGSVQFAAAADDPRIDTIVPMITWNNIVYSLAPNNATLTGSNLTPSVPGITKADWLDLFWLLGETSPNNAPSGGSSLCPNWLGSLCTTHDQLVNDGYPDSAVVSSVKDMSVANEMSKIRIPVMLMQGEDDTLFTLHESVATYDSLRAQHTPVKLVWQSWGHSDATPRPGELGPGAAGRTASGKITLEGQMMEDWMNYYLKHKGPAPALNFSFNRPWVNYSGDDAAKAYASAPKYPIGTDTQMYLSGSDSLVSSEGAATTGSASFTVPTTPADESISDVPPGVQPTPYDEPGAYAEFESAPLSQAMDVVGIPTVKLTVTAPSDELDDDSGPPNTLGLFFKLEDISGDGSVVTLPDGLVSAARFTDNGDQVTVDLPGIVHQFPAGDRIALVVAGSDASYFLPNPGAQVSVESGDGSVLNLPVAGSGSYGPVQLTK